MCDTNTTDYGVRALRFTNCRELPDAKLASQPVMLSNCRLDHLLNRLPWCDKLERTTAVIIWAHSLTTHRNLSSIFVRLLFTNLHADGHGVRPIIHLPYLLFNELLAGSELLQAKASHINSTRACLAQSHSESGRTRDYLSTTLCAKPPRSFFCHAGYSLLNSFAGLSTYQLYPFLRSASISLTSYLI